MTAPRTAAGRLAARGVVGDGAPLHRATGVVVALHGRGGSAEGMRNLFAALARPDLALVAPAAHGAAPDAAASWYPQRFVAPLAANQPWLDRALAQVAGLLEALAEAGVPAGRVVLAGFSQGACLALETAIRRPAPYAAVLGFAGGYIGPPEADPRSPPPGRPLAGVPVLLACAEADPHIPAARVRRTADLMAAMGARVDLRLRPGADHAIDRAGLQAARAALASLA